jgi:hypothetical protein
MASYGYEPVLSAKAWEFLRSLSRVRQQRLTKLIYQLADQHWLLGDYRTTDSTGRFLEHLRLEGYRITCWADGPESELRVLDIAEL